MEEEEEDGGGGGWRSRRMEEEDTLSLDFAIALVYYFIWRPQSYSNFVQLGLYIVNVFLKIYSDG